MTPIDKARGHRIAAILCLVGALTLAINVTASHGWERFAWLLAMGFLASLTISQTIKSAIWAGTAVNLAAIEKMKGNR